MGKPSGKRKGFKRLDNLNSFGKISLNFTQQQEAKSMADIVDHANNFAEDFVDDGVKSVRDMVPEERLDLNEDVECSCGTTIDPRRARLGYVCCIDCQSYMEKSKKQYNRRGSRNYDDFD